MICPLCSKNAIRVKSDEFQKLYIHKESIPIEPPNEHGVFRSKGGRACIVPIRKKRKK